MLNVGLDKFFLTLIILMLFVGFDIYCRGTNCIGAILGYFVPRGSLQFVIVVFPDHTHLLFLLCSCGIMCFGAICFLHALISLLSILRYLII